MPTYSYACKDCDYRFDIQQAFSDDALSQCPRCHGALRKVYSAVGVVFKGSGFYRTDSRAAAGSSSSSSSGSTSAGSSSSGGSSDSSGGSAGSTKSPSEGKGGSSDAQGRLLGRQGQGRGWLVHLGQGLVVHRLGQGRQERLTAP